MGSFLTDNLQGIAIGIRFRANFSIEDQIGKIVDQILYSKNSFFNPSVFPLAESGIGRKKLINEETGDYLKIDNSNIILEVNFGGQFQCTDLKAILDHFEEDIIKGIMKQYAIKEIVRVGYIKRYLFKMDKLARVFVDKTIGSTIDGINDINLRFSKKLAVEEGYVKHEVNDYDNAIFTIIKKSNLDEIYMAVDFQRYYDPFLESVTQIKFKPFVDRADWFNDNTYLPWLKSNYIGE